MPSSRILQTIGRSRQLPLKLANTSPPISLLGVCVCVCAFIKVQFVCNVVLLSGVQDCESVTLFQILSPYSLLQNIENGSYAI